MKVRQCKKCGGGYSGTSSLCNRCRGARDRNRERESIENKARVMVAKAKIRANKRGLPFDIDALSVVTLWYSQAGRCYLSGRPMTLTPGPRCISLDRRDSSKGYTRKNTALAAVQINGMKSDLRIEEFLDWCEAVTLNREGGTQ